MNWNPGRNLMFRFEVLGRLLVGSTQQVSMVEGSFRGRLVQLLISAFYLRNDSLEMG